jgi:DNA-binding NarL/FixJ family response regulator
METHAIGTKKLTNMIVDTYKIENITAIEQHKENRIKENKHAWKTSQRKKELTADEKRELVKMGKENGYTQKQVADQIGCSVRTVQKYWNN